MANKVGAAKEITRIFDGEWSDNFSAAGSTITTIWFEYISNRLNELES